MSRKFYVPPVPIIKAPIDLKHLGGFVNYKSRHRTLATREVRKTRKDFKVNGLLIDSEEDILYPSNFPPEYKREVYPKLIRDLGLSFEEHRILHGMKQEDFISSEKLLKKKGFHSVIRID